MEKIPVIVQKGKTHVLIRFPEHLGGKLGWNKIGGSIPPAVFPSEEKAREELAQMEQDAKRMGEYCPLTETLEFISASAEEIASSVTGELEDVLALLDEKAA